MYQALYRKWRPQTFDEVVGQKHITETLKNQIKTGRLSHAYLFIGTRGTGKTTCARILARAVNCEHPENGNPCGHCAACRGILEGSVLDVVELDAASNNSVDNVRALREEAVFSPAAVKKRVYIIDEVHMLSLSAFNALLKILEEPPEHLMFILATTELQKVPATILSRCQRHSFKRIEAPAIANYLGYIAEKEGFSLTRDAAGLIARLADGGVRDALSLLDQCSASETIDTDAVYSAMGLAGKRRILALMEEILAHRTEKALKEFNAMWMDGKDPSVLLSELSGLLRDVLMLKVAPKGGLSMLNGGYDTAALKRLGEAMTTEEMIAALESLQRSLSMIRGGAVPRTAAELCLVSLCDNTLGESVSSLRARIARLEEQVKNGIRIQNTAPPGDGDPGERVYAAEETGNGDDESSVRETEAYPENMAFPETDSTAEKPIQPETRPLPEETVFSDVSEPEEAQPADPAGPRPVSWPEICRSVRDRLPKDVSTRLEDEKSVRGRMDGTVLRIEVTPGFLYARFNRQDILASFAAAASSISGCEVRAVLSELAEGPEESKHSLEELRGFPEVVYIS